MGGLPKRNRRVALWVTYINIALYALCYQLQRPVEPFLVERLVSHQQQNDSTSSSSVTVRYGQLQSFFSAVQTIGSPIVGILLDRVGLRIASTIVFAASAASYALLATAVDMNTLFYSKIPTALQHAFLVAQAVAAVTLDPVERAVGLGRMTTAYTIGATIGPYLGGKILAETNDMYLGARLAVAGSLLSVLLSLLFLPASSPVYNDNKSKDIAISREHASKPFLSFTEQAHRVAQLALHSALWPLLMVKVVSGVASSIFDTAWPLLLTQQLHLDSASLGLCLSADMLATAAFGVVGLGWVTKVWGAIGVIQTGLIGRTLVGLILAVAVGMNNPPFAVLVTLFVVRGFASHSLSTGLTTQTTGNVAADEQGALLGLEHGLYSLARIGGPALGSRIWTIAGFRAVVATCGVIELSLLGVLYLTTSQVAFGRENKSKNP